MILPQDPVSFSAGKDIDYRLVDAIDGKAFVNFGVIESSQRHDPQINGRGQEVNVLGNVSCLQQRKTITTDPVLNPHAGENSRED